MEAVALNVTDDRVVAHRFGHQARDPHGLGAAAQRLVGRASGIWRGRADLEFGEARLAPLADIRSAVLDEARGPAQVRHELIVSLWLAERGRAATVHAQVPSRTGWHGTSKKAGYVRVG